MSKPLEKLKVAIISDHIYTHGGASRVTSSIGKLFVNPDYYFLFGDKDLAKKIIDSKNIFFSTLQKLPFLRKFYKYTYFLWPIFIETFDLSKYDLVISSSFSVSHGVVTGLNTKHISYVHTPMRYAWDMEKLYFNNGNTPLIFRVPISFFLNYLRAWDVMASSRSDILIANSKFVSRRMVKYWRKEADCIVYPPVELYKGSISRERENYFVVGAPFEINKGGDFLFDCAKKFGFTLKVIGGGGDAKRYIRKYGNLKNIEFLGYIAESEKFEILSKAKGFLASGIEDFGIFPVEALSCGTPVLALRAGGYLESVVEDMNGVFFEAQEFEDFARALRKFEEQSWDYIMVAKSSEKFSSKRFEQEFKDCILKNL